jgi:hypothetical protein
MLLITNNQEEVICIFRVIFLALIIKVCVED